MKDFRNNEFLKNWFSAEDIETLWSWVQKSGNKVQVSFDGQRWSGFHIEDKEKKIEIGYQQTKEDCYNWMKRFGFEVVE